ncbi:TonB-dependent receptor [Halioxenophilus sp. WMMB6]|uniref:TonB-dependent receptor n=1 Tax=Halioxenophilus sp. WMMB6 TaxID=3073815 RepID=UPI00295E8D26|nr:TonB-dependent receptor [Halioxenophilus sp. WMMB6]
MASSAMAQQSTAAAGVLEEVTVTAQRRSEKALDVPIAITAIGSEQLGKGDVQQLSDIMKLTPGLRFDYTGNYAQPTIRGVGTAVVVAGGSSNVGIYADGFYTPSPLMADVELLNIESVQVLKGPQGTLFGRNSTGGAILLTTTAPSSEFGGQVEASYGNYNTSKVALYMTGGPSDDLAFDVAGSFRASDGYVDNIITGSDTDAEYENSSVRLGAKWQVSDNFSALFRYGYARMDDNTYLAAGGYSRDGVAYSTAAVYGSTVATDANEVSNGFLPQFDAEGTTAQLTLTADFDAFTLTSYTQVREEEGTHYEDFDASALPIFHFIFDSFEDVFTQEFLLSSNDSGPLQWTTGLFYFENTSAIKNNRGSVAGGPFVRSGGSSVDVSSVAVFGDATYALADNLFLTLGLRYSRDSIDHGYFLEPTVNGLEAVSAPDVDDDNLAPRLALRYAVSDNASLYASYTEGFKSGILNVGGGTLDNIEVEPEEIKAYEVGYKFGSGSLAFDLSAYYYDYSNLQVASFVADTSVIRNAADSTVYGAEGAVRYAIDEHWEVNLSANYLKAEYDQFDQSQVWAQCLDFVACGPAFGVFLPSFTDASGFEMQRSPEWTANLGVAYQTQVDWGYLNFSGNLYYTSDFFFDAAESYPQDSYQLLSLRAEWSDPSDQFTVAVYGDNLTDEEYRNQVLPQFYGPLTTWGAPRTFGVSVGYTF